jgi:photosystem II stability/assembly factor-like uncharacterized protein
MRILRFILIPAVLFLLPRIGQAGWVQQQSGTTANLRKVFFVNSQTGWTVGDGNFMLHTTDGGVHWVSNIIDTLVSYSEALWFQDANLGWVAGSNGLYKTTDGGVNWRFLQNLTGAHYRDIVFVIPQKGWATTISGPDTTSRGYYIGRLFRSSDGGETWALRDSSASEGYWKISFADSMFGMLAQGYPGHGVPIRTDSWGVTRRTTDGGETWQTLINIPDSGDFLGIPMYTNVRLLNRNYAWRASYSLGWYMGLPFEGGGIYKTTVGGDTWTRMLNGRDYTYGTATWRTLAFEITDTLIGYVLYSDSLMGTTDGGASWVVLALPGTKRDIVFADTLNGWIVGDQGLILHTTDGGLGVWEEPSSLRFAPYALCLTVSPNPFTSFASVPGHSTDRFSLYDVSGRRVGTYRGDRIGEGLATGVYFIKAEKGDRKPLRIVKVR